MIDWSETEQRRDQLLRWITQSPDHTASAEELEPKWLNLRGARRIEMFRLLKEMVNDQLVVKVSHQRWSLPPKQSKPSPSIYPSNNWSLKIHDVALPVVVEDVVFRKIEEPPVAPPLPSAVEVPMVLKRKKKTIKDRCLDSLRRKPATTPQMYQRFPQENPHTVRGNMSKLVAEGKVRRDKHGVHHAR